MIDPRGMSGVEDWSDSVNFDLWTRFGITIRQLDHPDLWRHWAFHLIQSAQLARFNPPDPRGFDNWLDWAERFNQMVAY